jgi:hypothetical protein
MTAGMADRPAEEETLGEFLDAASSAPSALLVDGEAGIGKTTLWRAGLERACDRGFQAPAPNSPAPGLGHRHETGLRPPSNEWPNSRRQG